MSLTVGQAVQHPKFGIGVTMVVEGVNAVILFETGPRILVATFVTPTDATPESDALKASVPNPVPPTLSVTDAKPWIEAEIEKSKKRANALKRTTDPKKPTQAPIDFTNSPLLAIIANLKVDNRLYWQDHYDALAQEWAKENGVPTIGCPPNKFGKFGGANAQWSVCGRTTVSVEGLDSGTIDAIVTELSVDGHKPKVTDAPARRKKGSISGLVVMVDGYRIAAGLAKAGIPTHS